MKIKRYQVDAFTNTLFAGNPAAVCVVDEPLADSLMQAIAAENNLAETAFVWGSGGEYEICFGGGGSSEVSPTDLSHQLKSFIYLGSGGGGSERGARPPSRVPRPPGGPAAPQPLFNPSEARKEGLNCN